MANCVPHTMFVLCTYRSRTQNTVLTSVDWGTGCCDRIEMEGYVNKGSTTCSEAQESFSRKIHQYFPLMYL